MTSRALWGQKDCIEVAVGFLSSALAGGMEVAPRPMAAAVLVVRKVRRFILGLET